MSIVIVIIQVSGVAMIIGFVLALLNWGFGWHLGLKGAEVPGDPAAAVFFLVVGLILSALGRFLDKRFGR
jgi:hypothetical protein